MRGINRAVVLEPPRVPNLMQANIRASDLRRHLTSSTKRRAALKRRLSRSDPVIYRSTALFLMWGTKPCRTSPGGVGEIITRLRSQQSRVVDGASCSCWFELGKTAARRHVGRRLREIMCRSKHLQLRHGYSKSLLTLPLSTKPCPLFAPV